MNAKKKALSRNKFQGLFILLFICCEALCQSKEFQLSKGNCQLYKGGLCTYGLLNQKQNADFLLYRQDFQLKIIDSIKIDLGREGAENYLQLSSDTLHDYLNIYLQKKDQKKVTILRFNTKNELVAKIENVEITRLNNTVIFGSEFLYFKTNAYSVKTVSDTSGKQFYLNKYDLKSETSNFDYELKWQFPFERKNVHSAHVFYANKYYVLLYVTVNSGAKAGQWILKINSKDGKLIKGSKLNDKGESDRYQFGDFYVDETYRSLHLIGQKFTEAQWSADDKLSISNAPFAGIFHIELDSMGDVTNKNDFKVPIVDSKSGAKKTTSNYILRFSGLKKNPAGDFVFESDIFKSSGAGCYMYANSTEFHIIPGEEKPVLEKNTIIPNPNIEQYYQTMDKLDMNGKLCVDSINQFEKALFYKPITFPIKKQFKLDSDKNPSWILTKSTIKKNSINYSFLSPVKKTYQITLIEELPKSSNSVFIRLSSASFLISSQTEEGKYVEKLYSW
jgi:hypothetical protein